jgi:hypothetical protein
MTNLRFLTRIRILIGAVALAAVFGSGAITAPAASAAPATISPLQVKPGGTQATVTFTTSAPATVVYAATPVRPSASATPARAGQFGLGDVLGPLTGGAGGGATPSAGAHRTQHELTVKNLESYTAYDLVVIATTQAGERLTANARFTTQNKRIAVTLESINITDDGDLIGKGEQEWSIRLEWAGGHAFGSYDGSFNEGRITPRNAQGELPRFIFAQQNFDNGLPEALTLSVHGSEKDPDWLNAYGFNRLVDCIANGGCTAGEDALTVWRVPQGVEYASQRVTVHSYEVEGYDSGFRSALTFRMEVFHDNTPYPARQRNVPRTTFDISYASPR